MQIKTIIIIGAGWYGCYAALLLQQKYNVILIEKENDFFLKSSYYNQNRLHLGYHYCRDHKTRVLCKNGYDKFLSKFEKEQFVNKVEKNYYLISNNSLLDFETIFAIYKYQNYTFDVIQSTFFKNVNENIMHVNECMIDSKMVKKFFLENISCKKMFNTKVTLSNPRDDPKIIFENNTIVDCDFIIDCTFNALNLSSKKYIYEKTISLLYRNKSETYFDAITMIDGNFFSLYPHDIHNNIYSLTDVEFTPLIKSEKLEDIDNFVVTEEIIDVVKSKMENKVKYYYEIFKNHFEYVGYFCSNKTKLVSCSDSRECNIEKINDKLITINCGKITGIFEMEDYFKEISLL